MKKLLGIIFITLIFGGQLLAQDREDRSIGSFTELKASEGIDVMLKKGAKEAVVVETDDYDIDDVITEVSGNILKIHLDGYNRRGSEIKVYVTFVELDEISASSAANIYSESVIKGSSLRLSSSSAGDIQLEIEVEELEISVSSSGDVEVEGKAVSLEADASSAGEINAFNLLVQRADASASSAGSIKINVTEDIKARASSGATIRYRGNPKRSNTDSSSGGSVKKVD